MQIKKNKQMSAMTRDEFFVSVTSDAIEWNRVFEGIETAVISGDPNEAGSLLDPPRVRLLRYGYAYETSRHAAVITREI
jgi:hypothetical protein